MGEFSSGYSMDGESSLMLVNLVSCGDRGASEDNRLTGRPAQPFLPDYFQTVISLCEIIRQVYIKLGLMLVPNLDEPSSATTATTPQTANPYIPYRRVSEQATPLAGQGSATAPSAYNPPKSAGPGSNFEGGPRSASITYGSGWKTPGRAGGSAAWSPVLCELIMKADAKLKVGSADRMRLASADSFTRKSCSYSPRSSRRRLARPSRQT